MSLNNPSSPEDNAVSSELIRQLLGETDKFETKFRQLGFLHATQDVRAIGRLHTHYPGQRAELDFTKYGIFLYPNANWSKPVLYYDGMAVDHASTVVGSFVTTASPSAADVIRLYRRHVTPKRLWLPSHLQTFSQDWDVFGVPMLIAVDNGADFVAYASMTVYMLTGTIVLRVPPRRGDLKGQVERTHGTFEKRFISSLPGYVPRRYVGLNPKYTKNRERAMAAATMTVAEFEAKIVQHIQEFNHEPHPRLRRRRIDVYRSGLELAPPLLLTGQMQQRVTFALTFEVTLTREGVEVESLKFNSDALHEAYLTYSGRVIVKVDPDDLRAVLVLLPKHGLSNPIEAFLTTFSFKEGPISLELHRMTRRSHEAEALARGVVEGEVHPFIFERELEKIQSFTGPSIPTTTPRKEMQAAVHAGALPAVQVAQNEGSATKSLADLLGESRLTDD